VLDFLKARDILDESEHVKDELKRAIDALHAAAAEA
jgi:NTE family protein